MKKAEQAGKYKIVSSYLCFGLSITVSLDVNEKFNTPYLSYRIKESYVDKQTNERKEKVSLSENAFKTLPFLLLEAEKVGQELMNEFQDAMNKQKEYLAQSQAQYQGAPQTYVPQPIVAPEIGTPQYVAPQYVAPQYVVPVTTEQMKKDMQAANDAVDFDKMPF